MGQLARKQKQQMRTELGGSSLPLGVTLPILAIYGGTNPHLSPTDHENEPPSSPISKMSDKTGTGALAASCWRHQQLREPRGVKEHARTKCGTPSQTRTKPNRPYGREGDESLSRVRRAAGS